MKKILFLFLFIISSHFFSQTSVAAMQNAESSFDKMSELFRTGKYEEAEKIGGELLSNEMISNKSVVKFYALYLLGNCYYFEGKYKKATESFQKLVEFDGSEVDKKEYKSILANAKDLLKDLAPKLSLDTSPETKTSGTGSVNGKSVSNISNTNSQENKTVTLTVSGTGKTLEEAKTNALRSAIEQAFGAFISSKTEILNDNLVKDEIVSVTNGNIQKYDVISQVEIPNNGFAVTLNATVSISKLTSFVENKGFSVEFKGGLFAFNITQQMLNEQNELRTINDLCDIIKKLSDTAFDYKINASEPISNDGSNDYWKIPLNVSVYVNDNFFKITSLVFGTLKNLSLSKEEAINYHKLGKKTSSISMALNENDYDYFILRNQESINNLLKQFHFFNHSILNFKVSNGIHEFIGENDENFKSLNDDRFKFIIRNRNDYSQGSVYNARTTLEGCFGYDFDIYGRRNQSLKPITVYDYNLEYTALYSNNNSLFREKEFIDQEGLEFRFSKDKENFSFLTQNKMIEKYLNASYYGQTIKEIGQVISFITVTPNTEIVNINYIDIVNLNDLKRIQEYKVIPLNK